MKRYGAAFALVALATSACGSSSDQQPLQTVHEPVVGGYVDDVDKGAVGLAISIEQLGWFFGHCSGTLIAPNLVLTPHIGSASRATRARMAALATRNLLAGLTGAPMPRCANPEFSRVAAGRS